MLKSKQKTAAIERLNKLIDDLEGKPKHKTDKPNVKKLQLEKAS